MRKKDLQKLIDNEIDSLDKTHPELAKEWHPQKNGTLTPEQVHAESGKTVWWLLPYDDPKTGKHFDFEWKTTIANRAVLKMGCPYLSGHKVMIGYNDLGTTHPDIAAEWHPKKNGELTPQKVVAGSAKTVWWYLPFDDPNTGKHFDFEWKNSVRERAKNGQGCPFLSGRKVFTGFNDLATINPEIAKEWHPEKNGLLRPDSVTSKSNKNVWWLLPYDDPITGRHFDFEWKTSISNRTQNGSGCPFTSTPARMVYPGFNDLATLFPDISKEWHPTKNGKLKACDVLPASHKKVWWYLPYLDNETGEFFHFEWESAISDRTYGGNKCPFISGKAVWKGFNDLSTKFPDIAKEWHPQKNGSIKPDDIAFASQKNVWWYYPYDDPNTGKHFNFEWETTVANRTIGGNQCPFISGRLVWKGFNDLSTTHPNIASEWHHEKNGSLKPTNVTAGSGIIVWWRKEYYDPVDNKEYLFEWKDSIKHRHEGRECPYISSSKGEQLIHTILEEQGVHFSMEYKVVIDGGIYRFDFWDEDNRLAIEYDGYQHFYPIPFYGGEEGLKKRISSDNVKNQYCKRQGISLLRIPYTYDPFTDKDQITTVIEDFIQSGKIPFEIMQLYKEYGSSYI